MLAWTANGRRRGALLAGAVWWAAALSGLACVPAPAAPLTVLATASTVADHTRIVLSANRTLTLTVLALKRPERLLLEVDGLTLDGATQGALASLARQIGPHHPYLQVGPVAQVGPGLVRVTLLLAGEAEARLARLAPSRAQPYRMALDIYPTPASAPAAARAAAPAGAPAPAAASGGDADMWLAAQINGQGDAGTVLVLRRAGRWLVRGADLQTWRLRLPAVAPERPDGAPWYGLDSLPGLRFRVDDASQSLALDVPAALFSSSQVDGQARHYLLPDAAPPGAFFNYDLAYDHTDGASTVNGQFELGGFAAGGTATTSVLAQQMTRGGGRVRLDSTWTDDQPARMATLRLGDSISGSSAWGRSVRFGGVQWATNFSTQPALVTYPQPGVSGEAVVPSTVDLYVNNALRLQRSVPAGPFTIDDVPVVTGMGETRVVVRDLLGRETSVNVPYYASASLLRAGLAAYSYELGFVRNNYGSASNDYGQPVAIGTHRLGLSDTFTGELHGELEGADQTLGLSTVKLWPRIGVLTASLAGSHSDSGGGGLAGLGFQRQQRDVSFGANVQMTDAGFREVGADLGNRPARLSSQLYASVASAAYGAFSLSHLLQTYRDRDTVELISAGYSRSLGQLGYVSLSVLRTLGSAAGTSLSLTYTHPLGKDTSASVSATQQGGSQQLLAQVQRSLPTGSGYGYRLLDGAGDSGRHEAELDLQNDAGTASVDVARQAGVTALRGSVSGGVALLGGHAYLSRSMDQSFGVVHVSDFPNVRVYDANQLVGRTDASGTALLPRLLPYQHNAIRIEQADLPMDAEIDQLELDAVPYYRSGVLLTFPVRRVRGAVLTVLQENGRLVPPGASAELAGQSASFPVGLNGALYLTGLLPTNVVTVRWLDRQCRFQLDDPVSATGTAQPDLGRHICKGIK